MKTLPETIGALAVELRCDVDDREAIQAWIYSDPEICVSLLFALIYQGYVFPWEVRLS